MDTEYKVDLESYNGPLDLLLYLIQKDEVDIYDIPIARITEQYMNYLNALNILNLNVAGEFLVMAATLMHIKSKALLPVTEIEEEEDMEDPRLELVKQLLEYKRYKETAATFAEKAEIRSMRFSRLINSNFASQESEFLMDDIDLWDLVKAFSRLMEQTLGDMPVTIVDDDTPIHVYMSMVLERLSALGGTLLLFELFSEFKERKRIIGIFLALLELVRLRRIRVEQSSEPLDVRISLSYTPKVT
ncbi:MAG TPA: segregation and condensation protein A [Candidatus Brocadiia bacterium]|nr:segregation/condensation protein A [Candidatus Brocadiales bacterium]